MSRKALREDGEREQGQGPEVEAELTLADGLINIPLASMKPWYMYSKVELALKLDEMYGNNVVHIENDVGFCLWVKCGGESPNFLLVHHIDTVRPHSEATFEPYYLEGRPYLHSPHNDDRLGVATAMATLPANGVKGYDLLITDMEEVSKTTARQFMAWLGTKDGEDAPSDEELARVDGYKGLIEFDRGGGDWVCYDYRNEEAEQYLQGTLGWTKGHGTFTDIGAMSGLGIFGVNFGTGYMNAHSYSGYAALDVYAWCVHKAIQYMKHFGADDRGKLINEPKPVYTPPKKAATPPVASQPKARTVVAPRPFNTTVTKMLDVGTKLGAGGTGYTNRMMISRLFIDEAIPLSVDSSGIGLSTTCVTCASSVATMGKFAYDVTIIVDGDITNRIGPGVYMCSACYQAHRPRPMICLNHVGKTTIYDYSPASPGMIIPGDNCDLACGCHLESGEPRQLSSMMVNFQSPVSGAQIIDRSIEMVMRCYSAQLTDAISYYCDSDGRLTYLTTNREWWDQLAYADIENDIIGIFSPTALSRAYGTDFMAARNAILQESSTPAESLARIKDLQIRVERDQK